MVTAACLLALIATACSLAGVVLMWNAANIL